MNIHRKQTLKAGSFSSQGASSDILKQDIDCVSIIIDGETGWTGEAGLPSLWGLRRAKDSITKIIDLAYERGLSHLVVHPFSALKKDGSLEKFNILANLFIKALQEILLESSRRPKKISVRIVGNRHRLDVKVVDKIKKIESRHNAHQGLTIWVTLTSDVRDEVIGAVNRAIAKGVTVSEKTFRNLCWSAKLPDPDITISTGSECRVSGLPFWQLTSGRLFF